MSVDGGRIASLAAWLCDGARPSETVGEMVAQLCGDLVSAGLPLDRFALYFYTIHPLVKGRRFVWERGEADVLFSEAPRTFIDTEEYQANIVPHVMRSGETVRVRLGAGEDDGRFEAVAEMAAEGFTDYLMVPLIGTNGGDIQTASWATRAPGGFSDAMIAAFETLRPPLARLAEIHTLRTNAENVLTAYLGRNIGRRVLAGQVARGESERIEAVILVFDIADYTRLSNENPPDRVIGWLDTTFDIVVEEVEGQGGEVLKFLGDGLIAIFPTMFGPDGAFAALSALAAIDGRLGEAADAARAAGLLHSDYRAALHVGSVMFGNVGARHRLDFTVIGPAVNLASRLAAIGSEVGERWISSEPFAALSPWPMRSLGERQIKGFAEPVRIFALDAGTSPL